ncbi:TRAP transporter small permease [Halarsenatibacter silvermanii]|uniref:TRAP-type C4-dicarboxylate transport system, small permease component n=1 Tax=Halarsenatibacter silvermanii TaxID=321763 RepID=A0A1G9SFN4_9FIRM|nr:TRAP transporter small permease [Halarsenatibacter silvermanii]SDM34211.1 TRAP-type C4-dicarboxylate transport system, small permease component [Halarsenatibacter silvermanii]
MEIIKNIYYKFRKTLKFLFRLLLAVNVIIIISIVNLQVFYRYVLSSSLPWVDELSRFVFIWIGFIGAAVAHEKDKHIGLVLLLNKLSKRSKRILQFINEIIIFIAVVVLMIYGYESAITARHTSPALHITMMWVYMCVPIAGVYLILVSAENMADKIIQIVKKGD